MGSSTTTSASAVRSSEKATLPKGALPAVARFVRTQPAAAGVAIFALAAATRCSLILSSHFLEDEILFWNAARDLAHGTAFPLLGPSISGSVARHPGPLLYCIIAIPLLFTSAPEACNGFVALLGAATVVLYWQSLRSYFGEIGALLAALLMACMPWSTLYADRIWNPNVLGFFVATALWAACRLRKRPSLAAAVVLFVSMAAMPQLHLSSPMVWLALLPIWLPEVRAWRWHWAPIAALSGATLYIPMILHELRTHGSNTLALLHETSPSAALDFARVPLWAFRLMTLDVSEHQLPTLGGPPSESEMVSLLLHGNSNFHYGPVRGVLLTLSLGFAAFAIVVAVGSAWSRANRRSRPFFWAAFLGLLANTALLAFAHKRIFGHYVQALLPFYFVAFAELGRWAARSVRASIAVWGVALLVCIGGIDAAIWVSRTLDARNGLLTMRRVIAAIEADQPDAFTIPIEFDFPPGSTAGYNVLASLDSKRHVFFVLGWQYRLILQGEPRPRGARLLLETGPVALYRMREFVQR
jgi:hypothetical protein